MDGKRIPKRVLEWKPTGRRIRERPRKIWVENTEEDIQALGMRGWRKLSKQRTEWRRITRLKPIVGCNANKRRRSWFVKFNDLKCFTKRQNLIKCYPSIFFLYIYLELAYICGFPVCNYGLDTCSSD